MLGRHRRRPLATYTWHVQFAAKLTTKLPAREASGPTGNMAATCHLGSAGNLTAGKANELEGHQWRPTGQHHSHGARRKSAERRRIRKQFHCHRKGQSQRVVSQSTAQ